MTDNGFRVVHRPVGSGWWAIHNGHIEYIRKTETEATELCDSLNGRPFEQWMEPVEVRP